MNYQIFFIFLFILTLLAMKFSSLIITGNLIKNFKFLFNSPLISPKTQLKSTHKTNQLQIKILKQFLLHSFIILFSYEIYHLLFATFIIPIIGKSYLFSFYVYFFTNFIASSARVFSLLTNEVPIDMHNRPYLSKSLSEFWGIRWNKWVQDWLNLISKKCAPKSTKLRLFWAFFFSGLFHEAMFSLPYTLYYKENMIGLMMLYFILQFIFMLIDRYILRSHIPRLRQVFMWIFVLSPIPLFVNKPLLSFFGFL